MSSCTDLEVLQLQLQILQHQVEAMKRTKSCTTTELFESDVLIEGARQQGPVIRTINSNVAPNLRVRGRDSPR